MCIESILGQIIGGQGADPFLILDGGQEPQPAVVLAPASVPEQAPAPEPDKPQTGSELALEAMQGMNVGEKFAVMWQRMVDELDRMSSVRDTLRQIERAVRGLSPREDYLLSFQIMDDMEVRTLKRKTAGDVTEAMIRIAERQFSPPGVDLSIDVNEIDEKFPRDRENPDKYDAAAIWAFIEGKYSGDYGKRLGFHQVAEALNKYLMEYNKEVVVKGGYVVLNASVYVDSTTKKFQNKNELGTGSREKIVRILNAFADISAWAELFTLRGELLSTARHFNNVFTKFESREKYTMGQNAEVVMVTYSSRFEFKLNVDFANQVQLFLGSYLEL